MKNRIIFSVAAALLVIAAIATGVYYNQSVSVPTSNTQTQQTAPVTTISYKGKDGVTALVLLQQAAKIETSGTGEMTYVTSIDGVKAQKNQFWELSVNGKSASVGVGSLITKNTDLISWKLSSF